MARISQKQKRIGSCERILTNTLIKKIKGYRVFVRMKKQRETAFNDRLMDHLRQNPKPIEVSNRNIPSTYMVNETFRPEFYLSRKDTKHLCAVECKRLTESNAKSRWKEGLSQSLLYSTIYKTVVLVFFDFTKGARYAKHFGPGNKTESRFATHLRKTMNIYIIVLTPQ